MRRMPVDDAEVIGLFRRIIRNGGVVVYPTDTLYGFGVDAQNEEAVIRLEQIKDRSGPFSIMVGNVTQLREYALISPKEMEQLFQMLPGPYTLIFNRTRGSRFPASILGAGDTLGFRIPNTLLIQSVYQNFDVPVVSTSVNTSGKPPLQNPDAIEEQFGNGIDLLIDGGLLPDSLGSTVIDATRMPWKVLRRGDGRF